MTARWGGVWRLGTEGERRMGYRSFTDSTGVEWHAWDVVPQLAERRVVDRRRARQAVPFRDRRLSERRLREGRRAVMAPGLTDGWLCFEAAAEKRRLSPIPGDWARCPEPELEAYCQMARPVRRSAEIDRHSGAPG
jgi:hypothetical protein